MVILFLNLNFRLVQRSRILTSPPQMGMHPYFSESSYFLTTFHSSGWVYFSILFPLNEPMFQVCTKRTHRPSSSAKSGYLWQSIWNDNKFFENTLLFQCVLISSWSHQDWWLGDLAGVECLSFCQLSIVPSMHPDPGLSQAQPLTIVELADPYLTQCYLSKLNAATSG